MAPEPWAVVCMGVSSTGKSSVAARLAERLGVAFVEGDDHHPAANVEKMESGTPLDDDDRRPWLGALARILAQHRESAENLVMTCSALKRSYRDLLRADVPDEQVFFVHLHGDRALLRGRMRERTGHFMPTSLLDDQFETLEALQADEHGRLVDVAPPLDEVVEAAHRSVVVGLLLEGTR